MTQATHTTFRATVLAVALTFLSVSPAAVLADTPAIEPFPGVDKAPRDICALLDDPEQRRIMDAVLVRLLIECGRENELGQVHQEVSEEVAATESERAPDVQVNDSSGDSGSSTTQSETSLATNPVTGTICSGYNDSYHGVVQGTGYTGFSRSTDGGATFEDLGALGANSGGDPSLVWRKADGHFYFAALENNGLGVWQSIDDCQSFQYLGNSHVSGADDKELLAVDNADLSPFYGRLYMAWKDFGSDSRIYVNFSSDGGQTWSSALAVSAPGASAQGAWPAVAPNGDVYVGWVRWRSNVVDMEIVRSTDGGVSFAPVTNPATGKTNPEDGSATSSCFRQALRGNIRYLPSPQVAVGPDGALHVVYTYDPDGAGSGDTVDAFYRRSTDSGATWETEVRLNDDVTTTDQFFPTLSVGANNIVAAAWYDRRNDPANSMVDYYQRLSYDGGATWEPNVRLSDASTPIYIDPNLATCYHGDYDQSIQTEAFVLTQWADDRNLQGGHNDPDVFFEATPLSTDFLVIASPNSVPVCAPADAVFDIDVLQFQGFAEAVLLSTSGEPAGTTTGFSVNPITPPGASVLTVSGTGAAAAGTYAIDVVGTSVTSSVVHDTTVTLDLFDQVPVAPVLTAPPNGSFNVDLLPELQWEAVAFASSYQLEVATDTGFTAIVYSAQVDGTTHTVTTSLEPTTAYHWRVRGSNVCGVGADSMPHTFVTRAIPPILLVDDDDNNPDVRSTYLASMSAMELRFDLWDTDNSDNEPTAEQLAPYDVVIWFTGDEYGGYAGPGPNGEAALATWLDSAAGCLFISSQEYYYDRGLTDFMRVRLGVASATSDTSQSTVTGAGSVFGGLGPYALSYPFTNYSDTVNPGADGELAFTGNAGNAAVTAAGPWSRTFFLGFPFVALPDAAAREEVLQVILDTCATAGADLLFYDGFEGGDLAGWSFATVE